MDKKFLILISLLLMSTYIYASGITVSFPENITLVDNQVSVELYVYNGTNISKQFNLTSHTTPFVSSFSENQFRLNPNESKRISVIFNPLENNLEAVYNSSIEVKSQDYYNKVNFIIIQKTNRTCGIDLQYFAEYIQDSSNYKIDLIFKNNSTIDQTIEIIDFKDVNLTEELNDVNISRETEVSITRFFETDKREVILEYRCNGILGRREIELPKKTTPKDPTTGFTGLFTFVGNITLGNFINSVVFQIILVVVLIILVLSFSTKYIKYIYRR